MDRVEGRGQSLWLILSWAGWSIWTSVFCSHMEPCTSEQRSLLCVLGFCTIFSVLWSEAIPISQFSDILWLLPLQSVWVHCQEARQCHRQRMPPLRRAWSRTTCQCHCKLCIKSHDWIPEEDLMPFHPWTRALCWLHRRKSLWEGERLSQIWEQKCLNIVIPNKKSREDGLCIVFARAWVYFTVPHKALFLRFCIRGPKPHSPYLTEA